MAADWTYTQVFNQMNSGRQWPGGIITYSFPTNPAGMTSNGERDGFKPVTPLLQPFFLQAIQTWDDLIEPTFQARSTGTTDLEFGFTSTDIEYAQAYLPPGGTSWFRVGSDVEIARIGTYGFTTILHELGHALGLNHMGDYNGAGIHLPSSRQDSVVLSIMSYFNPNRPDMPAGIITADWISANGIPYNPQTPMVNDIRVIQDIYGASTSTRHADTVYGFSSNIQGTGANIYDFSINRNPILTIFDTGGIDTLNLSGWNTRSVIYLDAGSYSSCNDMTDNIAIAYSCVIENAIGGGGNDDLVGNSSNNRLEGGAGIDRLEGRAGDDVLIGGTGNDTLIGGEGNDTAVFAGAFSSYTITYSGALGAFTVVGAATGSDTVSSVEFFQFSDVTKAVQELLASDLTPPLLTALLPSDNSLGVYPNTDLVFTFNEAIRAGSGNITIFSASGATVRTIAVTDATQVDISGNTLTVNPASDLAPGSSYYIGMAAGAVRDLAGNNHAGLSGSTAFNFSTAPVVDNVPPILSNTSPIDSAIDVPIASNVVLVFNETVIAGSGSLIIHNANGSVAQSISVNDASQVTFSSNTVTINPSRDFASASGYYVNIASGVIRDTAGNAFPGIAGSSAFNFTTAAPAVQDDYPWDTNTTGLVVVGGLGVSGTVETIDDNDLFKVNLVAGTKYVFDLVRLDFGLSDPYLQLYSPSVELITFDDDGGDGTNSRINYTAAASGAYFLGAMDYGSGTGGYRISASLAPSVVDDFSDNTGTIGTLAIGGQATGAIERARDEDWFRVSLTAGTTYAFELRGADSGGGTLGSGSAEAYLTLFDSRGFYVRAAYDGGLGGDPLLSFTPSASGNYYLAASDLYDTGTGTYTLRARTVVDDYSDNIFTTGSVAVGGQTGGNIEIASDEDWFRVGLVAGTTYAFELRGADGGGGTLGAGLFSEAYLRLFDSRGFFIDSTADGGVGDDPLITYTATATGNYFLSASDLFDSTTGTYTLRASVVVDDYASNTATTGFLVVGRQVRGEIERPRDEDWFKVNLQAGTRYVFELSGLDSGGGSLGAGSAVPYLALYDTRGFYTTATSTGGTGGDPLLSFLPSVSGTYYLSASDLFDRGSGTYTLRAGLASGQRRVETDFNGDGKSDILWRNDNGYVAEWQMNGLNINGGGVAPLPTDWQLVDSAGDFNGDGKSDILWRNASGYVAIWQMNGLNIIGGGGIASLPADWRLVDGGGDYNGDGKSDILWQNESGYVALWLMDGTSIVLGTGVDSLASGWRIADGSGDYNGDGKSDILWRHSDGAVAIWEMNGAKVVSSSTVGTLPAGWTIRDGAGDYNGDGKSDILWQNDSGYVAAWLMNGRSISSGGGIASLPANWSIQNGSGDYNGDGKSDILWRNDSGYVAIWQMNGLSIVGGGGVASLPLDWKVMPLAAQPGGAAANQQEGGDLRSLLADLAAGARFDGVDIDQLLGTTSAPASAQVNPVFDTDSTGHIDSGGRLEGHDGGHGVGSISAELPNAGSAWPVSDSALGSIDVVRILGGVHVTDHSFVAW